MSDEPANPSPVRWWRHRRWQSYLALAGLLGMGAAALGGQIPEHAVPVMQTLAWALTTIVLVYSGGASAVDAMGKAR